MKKSDSEDLPTLDTDDWDDEENEGTNSTPGEMSFLEHLEDLRWTLMKSAMVFFISCALIIVFLSQFAGLLMWPYEFAVAGREDMMMQGLINTSILGVFSVIFYLMIGGGTSLSLPFMLYFFGQFISPGLTPHEIRLLRPACLGAFLLFLIGCTFSFFILVPAALRGSIIFNEILGFAPLWTAASYYGLLTWMVLGVGIAFEFPLVILILVYLRIITHAQLVGFRRYSVVIFLCISALVTPTTDPITFMLLTIPLSLLYELAIFGAKRIKHESDEED